MKLHLHSQIRRRLASGPGPTKLRDLISGIILTMLLLVVSVACQSADTVEESMGLPVTGSASTTDPARVVTPSATDSSASTAAATVTPRSKPPQRLLVASHEDQSLTIVDAKRYSRLETILLMVPPRDVAVTPDGRFAMITSAEPNTSEVVIFDLLGRQRVGEVTVGSQPWGIVIESAGKLAFVANSGSNTVSVIDVEQRSEIGTIPVGREPKEMAFSTGDGHVLYVANSGDNTVSVVDTKSHQVLATVPVGEQPLAVTASPEGQNVYVANAGDHSITVVDVSQQKVAATIRVNGEPSNLRVSPDGRFLYATLQVDQKIVDTEPTPTPTAVAGSARYEVASIGVDDAFRYSRGMVAVIDLSLNQVVGHVAVAQNPIGVVFSEDGTRAYVVGGKDSLVTVIDVDRRQVLANIEVGDGPIAITSFERPRFAPPPEAVGSRQ